MYENDKELTSSSYHLIVVITSPASVSISVTGALMVCTVTLHLYINTLNSKAEGQGSH